MTMRFLTVLAGIAWLALAAPAAAFTIGDDGLHKEDWFSLTFKDIAEDIATAKESGKRLALIVEQRGCIYCKEVHEVVLQDPEVRDYIKEHFMVVQYNLHGSEEVTDTDGEVLTEKGAARKWRLLFTPTILFMPEDPPEGVDAASAAVAMMPGAFKKGTFLEMFVWVNDKGYEGEEDFQTYYNRRWREKHGSDEPAD
ncbi:MAG: thioredoxin fold domain-containing protein [Brucellaceae bacterium]|nr:thioredoxin fold domain-containing protein [Brucellaceae bacterium]